MQYFHSKKRVIQFWLAFWEMKVWRNVLVATFHNYPFKNTAIQHSAIQNNNKKNISSFQQYNIVLIKVKLLNIADNAYSMYRLCMFLICRQILMDSALTISKSNTKCTVENKKDFHHIWLNLSGLLLGGTVISEHDLSDLCASSDVLAPCDLTQ